MFGTMKPAVVCVGNSGINGLAIARSLGRRGVPVHVVALASSPQIASASRYCSSFTPAPDLASLQQILGRFEPGAVLYVENDPMLRALAPHAAELAARFSLADPIADAERLTDKRHQMRIARQAGIAVPRSWLPQSWEEILSLKTGKRLIAKPLARGDFKGIVAADAGELAAQLRGRIASPADVLVQEFIEGGDERIYAALCYRAQSHAGSYVLSVRKLRQTSPGAGVMAVGQAVDAPQVREMTRRLAKAAGAHGAFCTEFKLDERDGRYYFIEWNPRPAYFHSIGWRAGFDFAWLAYCDHAQPAQLPASSSSFAGEHYWINLEGDLHHLAKLPRLAFELRTWRPYLGPAEWAVFARDDLAPWRASLRQLAAWLFRRRSFGRALARLAAPRA
jgi:predicted ATP-grasp superfamily ATP-dependent carboligase